MTNKPYAEYMKGYYHTHKKEILEKTKAYRKLRSARYYQENKQRLNKLNEERKKRRRFEKLQEAIKNQESIDINSL